MPRHLVARALHLIPTHRQIAKTVEALTYELGVDEAASVIEATLTLLHAFGALQQQGEFVRAKDQRATYFIQSLRLWLEQADESETLITTELIRAMETRRVKQAEAAGRMAQPARVQAAAFVLIGRAIENQLHVLCQFDRQAGQYQLIGGRLEPDETATQAATREFMEEVGALQTPPMQVGADFDLHELLDEPIAMDAISSTYGAFTRYAFHVFHAHITRSQLMLGPEDAWIAASDLLQASASVGKPMGDTRVYHEIDRRIVGGLAGLASSF
jgi:8-oxo-dGTP pyrophosphatase MutT (NUDIX family)